MSQEVSNNAWQDNIHISANYRLIISKNDVEGVRDSYEMAIQDFISRFYRKLKEDFDDYFRQAENNNNIWIKILI